MYLQGRKEGREHVSENSPVFGQRPAFYQRISFLGSGLSFERRAEPTAHSLSSPPGPVVCVDCRVCVLFTYRHGKPAKTRIVAIPPSVAGVTGVTGA